MPLPLVVSGPPGVGRSTVADAIAAVRPATRSIGGALVVAVLELAPSVLAQVPSSPHSGGSG